MILYFHKIYPNERIDNKQVMLVDELVQLFLVEVLFLDFWQKFIYEIPKIEMSTLLLCFSVKVI